MTENRNMAHWIPEFRPGMLLEVLTEDNRLLLVGKVEWGRGTEVQIRDSIDMELPYIEYDTEVKLRGFTGAGPFVLKGQVMGNTKEFWRIENLWSLQAPERREYFRQWSSLEAKVGRMKKVPGTESEEEHWEQEHTVDCEVVNLSASGAMIRGKAGFQDGDRLLLTGVRIILGEPPFSFLCRVCWIQERGGIANYGCEFCQMTRNDQDRLVRGILDMQRRNLQARREDALR